MSSLLNSNPNIGQLLTLAVAFSAALAQGQSASQLSIMGAFFTIVGDTLNLFALEPGQVNRTAFQSQARQEAETQAAITSAFSLGETL